jgi:hypothetical protein
MKFLCLSNDDAETLRTPPTPEMMGAIGAFMVETGEHIYLTGALQPTEGATRITYEGGKRTVTDGPYAEAKELVAGFAIIDVPSREEAVAYVSRFAEITGIQNMEIRELFLQQEMSFDGAGSGQA